MQDSGVAIHKRAHMEASIREPCPSRDTTCGDEGLSYVVSQLNPLTLTYRKRV